MKMNDRLNIILLTRYFPPEIGTAANLFFELACGLKDKGHQVTVVTSFPWYNLDKIPEKYNGRFFMQESLEGIKVTRIAVPVVGPHKVKLAAGHLTSPLTSFLGGLLENKPDIIFSYSPPLFMGIAGWLLKTFKSVPFVLGVQDLHPQCYIDQGLLKNKLAIYLLESLEKFCYRKSTLITVHSEGNRHHISKIKGINENKVHVIANWIDTDTLAPLPRKNAFSREHDLNAKFVVGYAGTMGMSQGLMSIIDAADIIKQRNDIEFFLVGDGIEKKNLVSRVADLRLSNVRFLGMQPKSVYPYVLASSDVQLVTLNRKVKTPVVPSKILSTMAASRPVLASMPLDGDAPRLINDAKCGICIPAENPEALAEKIIELAENKNMCRDFSSNGLEYVLNHLSLKVVINNIEAVFMRLANGMNP